MRIPHLHHRGDIYLLSKEQWNKFSGEMLDNFRTRLAEVNTVPFEQLMNLGDAVGQVG
jgi:hypothetical protein